jgi:hypothetical protein
MPTQLNLKYSSTFTATTKVIDSAGEMSSEDVIQQQVQFNSNSLSNSEAKRMELALLPTPYNTPNAYRIYDINLEVQQSGYIRTLFIKSEKQFLYSTADTVSNLPMAARTLARLFAIDKGAMVPSSAFTPDIPYPKHIRLMNPLEVNGGGSGNDSTDIPIIVSVFIVVTPLTN